MRVVIAGFGRRGSEWPAFCRTARVRVAGVVDPDPAARARAERTGLATWGTLDAALDHPWDAAILASPEHLHAQDIRTCVRAGRPSLVEKPMTRAWRDAVDVAREVEEAGVPVLVAQNFRFLRREVVLRRLLADGVVGRPMRVTVVSTQTRVPFLREVEDVIWHYCMHHWDALRIRFGRPPDSIHVRPLPEVSSGSGFGASLIWDDGPEVAYLHHAGTEPIGYHEWVGCETGSLVVLAERVHVDRRGRRLRRVWRPRRVEPQTPLLRGLQAAVAGHPPADLGALENLQTIAMIEAAARSIASGDPVRVPEVLAEAAETRPDHQPPG